MKNLIRFILVVAALVASFEAGRASSRESCVSVPAPAAMTPMEAEARSPATIDGSSYHAECQVLGAIPECD